MLLDSLNVFDPKGTALTLATGTSFSSQVIDLGGPAIGGAQGRDLGPSANVFLTCALNGVTSGGAATLQIKLQGAPDNGSGAPGTYTDYLLSPVYTLAELQAVTGEQYAFPVVIPPRPPGVAMPRFLQLAYVLAGAALTAGTVFAFLSVGRDDQTAYMSGFTPPPTSGAGT